MSKKSNNTSTHLTKEEIQELRDIVINDSYLLLQTQRHVQEMDSSIYHPILHNSAGTWASGTSAVKGYLRWIELYETISGDNQNQKLQHIKEELIRNISHIKKISTVEKKLDKISHLPDTDSNKQKLQESLKKLQESFGQNISDDLKKNGHILMPHITMDGLHTNYLEIKKVKPIKGESDKDDHYTCTLHNAGGGSGSNYITNKGLLEKLDKAKDTGFQFACYPAITYSISKETKIDNFILDEVQHKYNFTDLTIIPGVKFLETNNNVFEGEANGNCVTHSLVLSTNHYLGNSGPKQVKGEKTHSKTFENLNNFIQKTIITDLLEILVINEKDIVEDMDIQKKCRGYYTPEAKKFSIEDHAKQVVFQTTRNINQVEEKLISYVFNKAFGAGINDRNIPLTIEMLRQVTNLSTKCSIGDSLLNKAIELCGGKLTKDNADQVAIHLQKLILDGKVDNVLKSYVKATQQDNTHNLTISEFFEDNFEYLKKLDTQQADNYSDKYNLISSRAEAYTTHHFVFSLGSYWLSSIIMDSFSYMLFDANVPLTTDMLDKSLPLLIAAVKEEGGELTIANEQAVTKRYKQKIENAATQDNVNLQLDIQTAEVASEPDKHDNSYLTTTAKFRTPGEVVKSTHHEIVNKSNNNLASSIYKDIIHPTSASIDIASTMEDRNKEIMFAKKIPNITQYNRDELKGKAAKYLNEQDRLKEVGSKYVANQKSQVVDGIPLYEPDMQDTIFPTRLEDKIPHFYDHNAPTTTIIKDEYSHARPGLSKIPTYGKDLPEPIRESMEKAPRPNTWKDLNTRTQENPINPQADTTKENKHISNEFSIEQYQMEELTVRSNDLTNTTIIEQQHHEVPTGGNYYSEYVYGDEYVY